MCFRDETNLERIIHKETALAKEDEIHSKSLLVDQHIAVMVMVIPERISGLEDCDR